MHVSHLSLTHFRNYAQQDLSPAEGANLLLGGNAQGKSNLLEALVVLSTTRSFRTSVDRHLVNRACLDEPLPYARLGAGIEGSEHRSIELVITLELANGTLHSRKHLRLDGTQRRLMDALGVLPTVLFTPEDVALASGPPATRRRYLDVLLCQVSREYCRALSLYNRSLVQRNHLLRLIRSRRSDPAQLEYWDSLLADSGAVIARHRQEAISTLAAQAAAEHARLAAGESLCLRYLPGAELDATEDTAQAVAEAMRRQYLRARSDDLERGVTTLGPHRDDFAIQIGGEDASTYASRGQMRTAALTLRLVEADYVAHQLGREPVLLFDDVMSELDSARRRALEEAMLDSRQSFVTALDASPFSRRFTAAARIFQVSSGAAEPINGPAEGADAEPPDDAGTPPGSEPPS